MIVRFHSKEYCNKNFYLGAEGYYYLSEEESERNLKEPVYEYLHEYFCEKTLFLPNKTNENSYSPIDFVEKVLNKIEDPEYFI